AGPDGTLQAAGQQLFGGAPGRAASGGLSLLQDDRGDWLVFGSDAGGLLAYQITAAGAIQRSLRAISWQEAQDAIAAGNSSMLRAWAEQADAPPPPVPAGTPGAGFVALP